MAVFRGWSYVIIKERFLIIKLVGLSDIAVVLKLFVRKIYFWESRNAKKILVAVISTRILALIAIPAFTEEPVKVSSAAEIFGALDAIENGASETIKLINDISLNPYMKTAYIAFNRKNIET